MGAHLIHAAVLKEPAHLALRHNDRRECGSVERLVLARVVDRGGQGQELRDPSPVGAFLDATRALDGRGGEDCDPQASVRPEGLLEGEVVGVDLGQVDGCGPRDRRAVHESERAGCLDSVDGRGDAGGCLVVWVGVDVDACVGLAWGHDDERTVGGLVNERGCQVRGMCRFGGELCAECAPGAEGRARGDEARAGHVPECGGAAVAQDDLVVVGDR